MLKIPDYLPLLTTIKQLFKDDLNTNTQDKDWLINWAQKTAILRLQLNGKAVSAALLDSLQQDMALIMPIIIKLNGVKGAAQWVGPLHTEVVDFYQQLGLWADEHSSELLDEKTLQDNWFAITTDKPPIDTTETGEEITAPVTDAIDSEIKDSEIKDSEIKTSDSDATQTQIVDKDDDTDETKTTVEQTIRTMSQQNETSELEIAWLFEEDSLL